MLLGTYIFQFESLEDIWVGVYRYLCRGWRVWENITFERIYTRVSLGGFIGMVLINSNVDILDIFLRSSKLHCTFKPVPGCNIDKMQMGLVSLQFLVCLDIITFFSLFGRNAESNVNPS